MINLKNRTEFSFHFAFGLIPAVLQTNQGSAAAISDRGGTWGHFQWQKHCKSSEIKPIFGVEIAFVQDSDLNEKQKTSWMTLLAKNAEGLQELYELSSLSTEKFYHHPRLSLSHLDSISDNMVVLLGNSPPLESMTPRDNFFVELNPGSRPDALSIARKAGWQIVATSDNTFVSPEDREGYEIALGMFADSKANAQHILSESEWRQFFPDVQDAIDNTYLIADMCNVELKNALFVKAEKEKSLLEMCQEGAKMRKVDLSDPKYKARLERELALIDEKDFEDYFYVVADLCKFAKKHMLVGPARGSSCGSLVCYLMDITDIDPLQFDLIFERFIDINRLDYPDIDIDFPDTKRYMVFEYLKDKYGFGNAEHIGTIGRFKAKSAIDAVSKALKIPRWEVEDLKGAILERSGGDARAAFCIVDTFNELEIGKRTLAKYPELSVAGDIEMHAKNTGIHAAGMVLSALPINQYCTVDHKRGCMQLDKHDSGALDLLKIDILGLRTLSVLQDCLDAVGWSYAQLREHPLDYVPAFDVLNNENFAGIFQFEGYALQSVTQQFPVESFEDVAAISALGRPGPLQSGGTTEFVKRRTGQEKVVYLHPLAEPVTAVTYGTIVYQEQVMQIAREIGGMSWEDVSSLRKAMSKSLGKEFFDQYWHKFRVGAEAKGIKEDDALKIWDKINTMGSWAFNRSHAVAYGMISYWGCVLKAKFPLEFAAACLRNAKDPEQSIKILRELHEEGYRYKPYDRELSGMTWKAHGDLLIGGLTGIKGIGEKTAQALIDKREKGLPFTERQNQLLDEGTTPYDMLFEGKERWGHVYADPGKYDIRSKITNLEDIKNSSSGDFVVIVRLAEKNLRDLNEAGNVAKRGGRIETGQTLFLNLHVEDDTGTMICSIDRWKYLKIGKPIVEEGRIGDWYLIKGHQRGGFRQLKINRVRRMTDNPTFYKEEEENVENKKT